MKVLHVLNHSVPHTDGYCVRSANIVRLQAEIGLDPVVVTSPRQEPVPTEPIEIIDGVRYYRILPYNQTRTPVLHELQAIRRLGRRIEEVVKQERPDVIHAHSPCLWGCAALRVAGRCGLPFVYEIRSLWEDGAVDQGRLGRRSVKYHVSRALETYVVRRATAVTAISQGLIAELVSRGADRQKVFLVPNGVDCRAFSPGPPNSELRARLGLNGVTVGYVGSLYAWEGVEDMIRAVPRVVAESSKVRFLVVGGGEQEQHLRQLVSQLSLETHVQLVGRVPHSDILAYYGVCDILVFPRKRTRLTELVTPLKPLEAMAMGKAILASDVGGLRELLPEGTAELYRSGSGEALADKCLQLVRQPEKRMELGRAAQQYARDERNWPELISRYLQVYAHATGATASRLGKPGGSETVAAVAASGKTG